MVSVGDVLGRTRIGSLVVAFWGFEDGDGLWLTTVGHYLGVKDRNAVLLTRFERRGKPCGSFTCIPVSQVLDVEVMHAPMLANPTDVELGELRRHVAETPLRSLRGGTWGD